MHELTDAMKALRALGQIPALDEATKKHLKTIADAVGEAEERLKALEDVVEELSVHTKLKSIRRGDPIANSFRVQKLLGKCGAEFY